MNYYKLFVERYTQNFNIGYTHLDAYEEKLLRELLFKTKYTFTEFMLLKVLFLSDMHFYGGFEVVKPTFQGLLKYLKNFKKL